MSSTDEQRLRNERGEFASVRDPIEWYYIVRDVARLAAQRDDDPLKDPRWVTQPAWDSARRARESKWGPISRASEICRHLRDYHGNPYPWRELLETVFDPSVDFAQHHSQRMSSPDRAFSDEVVFWAVNLVSSSLRTRTLRPNEYDAGRKRLLAQPKLSQRARQALVRVLPTANQLAAHCKTWDMVLEVGKLEPRLDQGRRGTLRVVDVTVAVAQFYIAHGFLPDEEQFRLFQRREDLACDDWTGRPWEEICREASTLVTAEGLPAPNSYPSKIPPSEWTPVELDLVMQSARGTIFYSHLQVLDSVYEFTVNLPAGEVPTNGRYKAFAHGKNRLPGLNVIDDHGGLKALVREIARNTNWREDAVRAEEARRSSQRAAAVAAEEREAEERTQRRVPRTPRPRDPERRLRFLIELRERGPLPNRELVRALGVSRMSVRNIATELQERGLVERTQQSARSPNQSYVLTTAGTAMLHNEAELRSLLGASHPKPARSVGDSNTSALPMPVPASEQESAERNEPYDERAKKNETWSIGPLSRGPALVAGVSMKVGLNTRRFAARSLEGSPADPDGIVSALFHRAAELAKARGEKMIWQEDLFAAGREFTGDDPDLLAVQQAATSHRRNATRRNRRTSRGSTH